LVGAHAPKGKQMKTLFAAAFLITLVFLSNPIQAVEQKPRYGGTMIVANPGDPPTLLPSITTSIYAHFVTGQIFNTLIDYNLDGSERPELAESWEISKDGLSYTWHLVKNAEWHDGTPFTSADVKYSFEELLPKYHPTGQQSFGCIERVDTPDKYTAVFRLKYAFPPLIKFLGLFNAGVGPKHIFEGSDPRTNPYATGEKPPIGTGPFKFVEWVKGDHITLVKNQKYFKKGRPYLDRIIIKPVARDPMGAILALEKGEIDYFPMYLPLSEVDRLRKVPGIVVTNLGDEGFNTIGSNIMFNLKREPYNNLKFRQAVAHAVDKTEIIAKAFYGKGNPASGPIHSFMKTIFNPATNTTIVYKLDREKANQLLDEIGLKKGPDGIRLKVPFAYDMADFSQVKTSEVLREQFTKIGIDLVLKPMEPATMYDVVWAKFDYDMALWRSMSTLAEPSVGAARAYLTSQIGKGSFTNGMQYSNPRIDELFQKVQREVDENKRLEMYKELQEILVRDLPLIWLVEPDNWSAYRDDFVGIPAGIYGGMRERQDNVWWKKGSELSPEGIAEEIAKAEAEIKRLQGQMYDVSDAVKKLSEAKQALNAGEYSKALTLVSEAAKASRPPYALYAAGVIAVLVIAGALLFRKRKKAKAPS